MQNTVNKLRLVASFTCKFEDSTQVFDLLIKDDYTFTLRRRADCGLGFDWTAEYIRPSSLKAQGEKTEASHFASTFSYQLSSICFW